VNGVNIVESFSGGSGGTVAKVCPATSCNYAGTPGFVPGDFLLWAEDANGNGTGPLTLTFTTPTQGAAFSGCFVEPFGRLSKLFAILTTIDLGASRMTKPEIYLRSQ
jgi:hypothetical protein